MRLRGRQNAQLGRAAFHPSGCHLDHIHRVFPSPSSLVIVLNTSQPGLGTRPPRWTKACRIIRLCARLAGHLFVRGRAYVTPLIITGRDSQLPFFHQTIDRNGVTSFIHHRSTFSSWVFIPPRTNGSWSLHGKAASRRQYVDDFLSEKTCSYPRLVLVRHGAIFYQEAGRSRQ